MSDNSTEIVQQIRVHFEALLARVQVSSDAPPTAYEMERRLVTDLLELGRLLLQCFFCSQHAALEAVESVEVGGKQLPLHEQKRRSLRSVFGKITFTRGYYYEEKAKPGYHLLDARLNLPTGRTSDLLREWRSLLACYNAYRKTGKTLASILRQQHSVRAIEDDIERDCNLAEAFCDQRPVPEPSSEDSVLVVQADGKGVPLVGQKQGKGRVRLGKGEKSGRKKEAIATAVYTIDPCIRNHQTRQPINLASEMHRPDQHTPPDVQPVGEATNTGKKRKRPSNKWLWATFKGKPAAIALAKKQVSKREGEHITAQNSHRRGGSPLQYQMLKQRHHSDT